MYKDERFIAYKNGKISTNDKKWKRYEIAIYSD